ncbi:MAG: outer membrane protein assembly factor BamA [Burkholderiales bacterium]|jgi:outer membrane protein insertion porin family|nr:outer membrane protein assembly factor BamA [Burkholderiales bacterium]
MRKRVLAAVVCAVIARSAWAFDPFTVRDIRVEGIQRIEAGTIFSYLPVKVGETMTEEKAQTAIKALFATGFFRDVRLENEKGVLVVIVEERPAIAQIDFVGMKDFKEEDVKKALREAGIAEGRTFDRATLETAEQEIKKQYLSRGRYGVTVTTTVTPLDRNRVGINFTIDEGDVAKIASINIVGNRTFPESELLKQFTLTTPGWITWYTKNDQYSRQKLQADLEGLRSFYLNRGFLDFNIDSTQVSITPDKRDIYITINITEGEKYTVSGVKLAGDFVVPQAELERLVQIRPGEPFSRAKLADSTKAINERLGNDGYAFANANAVPDIDKEKRTVSFTIMVDPGRRVYVRRITIVGNTRTRDEVVRRELRQLESSFYDGQKLQASKRRLDRTGYFSETSLETEPVPGTTDQVDVTVRVKEKPTGNLLFGLGYSSSDGLILSGSVAQTNFLGTGKVLQAQVSSGSVNRVYSLSYTNPYFTVDGVSAGFDAFSRRFDATTLSLAPYISDTLGGGVRFGYPVTEVDRIGFGLQYEQVSLTTFDNSPPQYINYVNEFGDSTQALIATANWTRDTRDSAVWTTTGVVSRALGEVTLPVLDQRYYKATYQLQWWYPITDIFTLRLNGEVGWAGGYSDGQLPFYKNYYAGGVSSVRGFEQSSLGPQDAAGGVLGGIRRAVGNAEILFPMPGLAQDRSVRLGVFFDVGQVWNPDIAGQNLSDVGGFRYSAGLSFGWNSPFGPLRLFLAQPLNEQEGDRIQRFQFTFGQQF